MFNHYSSSFDGQLELNYGMLDRMFIGPSDSALESLEYLSGEGYSEITTDAWQSTHQALSSQDFSTGKVNFVPKNFARPVLQNPGLIKIALTSTLRLASAAKTEYKQKGLSSKFSSGYG